jgi:hypothetical protein
MNRRSIFMSTFVAAVGMLVFPALASAGYTWTVTAPKDSTTGTKYSVTHIDIDATVTYGVNDVSVTSIEVEVWVGGVNRTGAGGSLSFPAQTAPRTFQVKGFQTVSTQNVNGTAEVRLVPYSASGPIANQTKKITIQLKP